MARTSRANGKANHGNNGKKTGGTRAAAREKKPSPSLSEVERLIDVLPTDLKNALRALPEVDPERELVEIVLDLGRPPEARLISGSQLFADRPVAVGDLAHVGKQIGEFTADNRAGIERTLHRIAAMRNRKGDIVGLTLRVGRAIHGTIDILRDLLESRKNLLLLGRPGVGKTTKLREIARVLADDFHRRVIVVDTSNEIGGDGDVPHPAIGSARRMQVPRPELQHRIMIEAVENHMPEVIVIDEIGTELEAAAARTIAERGVQLVGTAHGTTLENLILNPTVSDLVGGTHTVTLGDEEARRRRTAKTITERKAPATFDVVVEMVDRDEVVVYPDTAAAVDQILEGSLPEVERRKKLAEGGIERSRVRPEPDLPSSHPALKPRMPGRKAPGSRAAQGRGVRIYVHGLNPELVHRALEELGTEADIVRRADAADIVLAVRRRRTEHWLKDLTENEQGPALYYVKREKISQIRDVLRRALLGLQSVDSQDLAEAMQEAEHAIDRAINEGIPISLSPRRPKIRRLQHEVIARHNLTSQSTGTEPGRHLVVYPNVPPEPGEPYLGP